MRPPTIFTMVVEIGGHGIAFDKLGRTIHGPVKVGFPLNFDSAFLGRFFVNNAGV